MTDTSIQPGLAHYRPRWSLTEFLGTLRYRYFPPKSNLEKWAEKELSRLAEPGDEMQEAMNKHLLKMVRQFSREGHSGFSAHYAIHILEKLLSYKPLTPLTGEYSEWMDVGGGDELMWQNVRDSRVFKGADGRAYFLDGKVFIEPSGVSYTNRKSRTFLKFPCIPESVRIDVDDNGKPLRKAAKHSEVEK